MDAESSAIGRKRTWLYFAIAGLFTHRGVVRVEGGVVMRRVLTFASMAFIAACSGTGKDAAENRPIANQAAPGNPRPLMPMNGIGAAPTGPTTRVGGPPNPGSEYFSERGGISRPLSGEEGGGMAASRAAFINDLVGRWAWNCNTRVGELVFRPGGRFTAPGGSGRVQMAGNFVLTFTFADGETETWTAGMRPGELSLDPGPTGPSISRRLCSATP